MFLQTIFCLSLKVKVKCTLYRHWGSVQAVRPIGGVEVYLYSFMTNGTRRVLGISITPRPLFTPGKDPVPIVQEAGWMSVPVWTGAENLAPTGIRSPDRPACNHQNIGRLNIIAGTVTLSAIKAFTQIVIGESYTFAKWIRIPCDRTV